MASTTGSAERMAPTDERMASTDTTTPRTFSSAGNMRPLSVGPSSRVVRQSQLAAAIDEESGKDSNVIVMVLQSDPHSLPMVCGICAAQYGTIEELQVHVSEAHRSTSLPSVAVHPGPGTYKSVAYHSGQASHTVTLSPSSILARAPEVTGNGEGSLWKPSSAEPMGEIGDIGRRKSLRTPKRKREMDDFVYNDKMFKLTDQSTVIENQSDELLPGFEVTATVVDNTGEITLMSTLRSSSTAAGCGVSTPDGSHAVSRTVKDSCLLGPTGGVGVVSGSEAGVVASPRSHSISQQQRPIREQSGCGVIRGASRIRALMAESPVTIPRTVGTTATSAGVKWPHRSGLQTGETMIEQNRSSGTTVTISMSATGEITTETLQLPRSSGESDVKGQDFKVCEICSKVFPKSEIGNHILSSHIRRSVAADDTEVVECTVREDSVGSSLKGGKGVECDICGKVLGDHHSLRTHRWLKHSEKGDTLSGDQKKCDQCDKVFHNKRALSSHMKAHTKPVEPVRCTRCHREFRHGTALRFHNTMNPSCADTRYGCTLCSYVAPSPWRLNSHVMQKHSDERPYQCDYCPKRYKTKEMVRLHSHKAHTGTPQFECTVCQKKFFFNAELREHSQIHLEKKTFFCHICHKAFKTMHVLRGHLNGKHSDTWYSCGFCKFTTSHKKSMKRHMVLVHKLSNVTLEVTGTDVPVASPGLSGPGVTAPHSISHSPATSSASAGGMSQEVHLMLPQHGAQFGTAETMMPAAQEVGGEVVVSQLATTPTHITSAVASNVYSSLPTADQADVSGAETPATDVGGKGPTAAGEGAQQVDPPANPPANVIVSPTHGQT